MRVLLSVLTVLILCVNFVSAVEFSDELTLQIKRQNSQVQQLQRHREAAKLYAPNFVVIGAEAEFKVFTKPKDKVRFTLDYGSTIPKQYLEQTANDKGIAVFTPVILDEAKLVGKSVEVMAIIVSDYYPNEYEVAVLQTETGTPAQSNRIYIVDKDTAKGFSFSPINALNPLLMRDAATGSNNSFDPINNQLYPKELPTYIRNMREAQDNVREFPTNIDYTDR